MEFSIEDLTKKTRSLYGLVMCASYRANEIMSGEQPLIHTKSKRPPTIALEEIAKNKISFEVPKLKPNKF